MIRTTIGALAATLNVKYGVAAALVECALAAGTGKFYGNEDRAAGSRGKPSKIYELPEHFSLSLTAKLPDKVKIVPVPKVVVPKEPKVKAEKSKVAPVPSMDTPATIAGFSFTAVPAPVPTVNIVTPEAAPDLVNGNTDAFAEVETAEKAAA